MAKSLKVIIVISILRKKLGKQNNDEHGAIFFFGFKHQNKGWTVSNWPL